MTDSNLHVIFKTHLDLGFTGLAAQVRQRYHDHFIPMALDTGEHFLRENRLAPQFIWTTGSWLIWDHLETQTAEKVRRLEAGIAAGIIRWHALPFTTHTELMSARLLREGIGIARELDRRFGIVTRAAKMTDVPGHTLGAAAVMADEGIEFLHLGVNEACPVPDLPPVFNWRAPGGQCLTVMYQGSYGATLVPAGARDGIAFAHTSDNLGPQGVGHVVDAFRHLGRAAPGMVPRASTLDLFWDSLRPHRANLPDVTQEIGDTWIQGLASAPAKVRRYLAVQRALDAGPMTPPRRACARKLLEVAEHTWGVDIKTFLRDEDAWSPAALAQARAQDPRFAMTEASWAEQESLVDAALALLPPAERAAAQPDPEPQPPETGWAPLSPEPVALGPWQLWFDPGTGALVRLDRAGEPWLTARAGGAGVLAFAHHAYGVDDIDGWIDSYLVQRPDWGLLDHGRPGLHRHPGPVGAWQPEQAQIAQTGTAIWLRAQMPQEAAAGLGSAPQVFTCLMAQGAGLRVTLHLPGKRANRRPEALLWHMDPSIVPGTLRLRKMDLHHDPACTVPGGARSLHAVQDVTVTTSAGVLLTAIPRDAPLWQAGGQSLLRFSRAAPDPARGGAFVLAANLWGTNFPMWIEGDLTFTLDLMPPKESAIGQA